MQKQIVYSVGSCHILKGCKQLRNDQQYHNAI